MKSGSNITKGKMMIEKYYPPVNMDNELSNLIQAGEAFRAEADMMKEAYYAADDGPDKTALGLSMQEAIKQAAEIERFIRGLELDNG